MMDVPRLSWVIDPPNVTVNARRYNGSAPELPTTAAMGQKSPSTRSANVGVTLSDRRGQLMSSLAPKAVSQSSLQSARITPNADPRSRSMHGRFDLIDSRLFGDRLPIHESCQGSAHQNLLD